MTVAQYIAAELKSRGIRYVFGIPGGPSIPYIDELRKEGIEFILTSNEAAAGIMADVTGRLTGVPGICHATFGPGATNLATGVGGAILDRSPVIAMTSEVPDKQRSRTVQMNIDHQQLFEPITKVTIRADAGNIREVLTDAFELAVEEYPGPVHIGLPSDQAMKKIAGTGRMKAEKTGPEKLSIDTELIDLLQYSRKPVMVIGLTAVRAGIREEIYDFLEEYPVPVILTPMAKGMVHEEHKCYCGVLFHAASGRLDAVINESDLVIGIGYDPVEYNYESWMHDVPLIHFNTVYTDMPESIPAKQVVGNLTGLLEMIRPVLGPANDWDFELIADCRKDIQAKAGRTKKSFGPFNVLRVMKEQLPEDLILCLDVGSHIHFFGQYWKTPSPGQLLMTNGWSGMGFGIPAAISASLNKPGKPVACVTGDGGFLMMCGEMITARRLKLNILFIVLADRELNLIKIKEHRLKVDPCAVELYDDMLIGEKTFLGVPVISCDSEDSFRKALSGSYPVSGPSIIELYIDPSDYYDVINT